MTNRKAIDILRVINPPRESKKIFDEFMQARDMAIKALEKLEAIKSRTSPSDDWEYYADRLHDIAYQNGYEWGKKCAEQDRWIPCSVRLPKEDCECRVTFKSDFGKSVFNCYWNDGKKQFEDWDYFLDCFVPVFGVTAWKPIEEPYTEEE